MKAPTKKESPDLEVTGSITNPAPHYPFGYEIFVKHCNVRAIAQRLKDGQIQKLALYQASRERLMAASQHYLASQEAGS